MLAVEALALRFGLAYAYAAGFVTEVVAGAVALVAEEVGFFDGKDGVVFVFDTFAALLFLATLWNF